MTLVGCLLLAAARSAAADGPAVDTSTARNQVAAWSDDDMQFFLHGSMSTEVVPVNVLKAFQATYPELFPPPGLAAFGLLNGADSALPVGMSRRPVPHLGGLESVGINCAACHVADVAPRAGGVPVRVLGVTSHFDAEAFFGSVASATFATADPANLSRFLRSYLVVCDAEDDPPASDVLQYLERIGQTELPAVIAAHASDERTRPAGHLYELDPATLTLTRANVRESAQVARSLLQLFHNMRAALHIPHAPPTQAPPLSGPGRNNAFGVLSIALFGQPTIYGPAKYGVAWNLDRRSWVHWDGNTRSPIVRNLAASLGLGAPLVGERGMLDFANVERHTKLSEAIIAPRYPWSIDNERAARGEAHFVAHCARCHSAANATDDQLFSVAEVGTDPNRAQLFDARQAGYYNDFFGKLKIEGYQPATEPAVRSTGKYVAPPLDGVWARSPYLHNGSVRTMLELLTPGPARAKSFRRGSRVFDEAAMGYLDEGPYLFDTAAEGNSNRGHEYGIELSAEQKRELIEYLKTL
jgi:mono/diheme cytochrome c family protein